MKNKTKINRLKNNLKKGIKEGNSKYAKKKALQRKGVFSPNSPFYRGSK